MATHFNYPVFVQGIPTQGMGNRGYPMPSGEVYYVDGNSGSDSNDGASLDTPFATIQKAITTSNATIDWSATPKKYNYIYVVPAVYDENLTTGYYCIIEGLGIRGTDTAVEIHPSTGSAMTGTLLGSGFRNLRFEGNSSSTPIFDIGICNNSFVDDSEFSLGADVAGVAAIDTENATHFEVRNCDFTSGQLQHLAYAGYHRGGADKYAHNVRWLDNRIWAKTAGLWIQSTCTATGFLAMRNMIWIDGSGKGIDCNYSGAALLVNNYITGGSGADAIEHSGGAGYTTYNHTNIDGAAAEETA